VIPARWTGARTAKSVRTRATEAKRNLRGNAADGPLETASDAIQLVATSRADETSAARIAKSPIKENAMAEATTETVSAIESLELEIQRRN
jgi:hypothetical protein